MGAERAVEKTKPNKHKGVRVTKGIPSLEATTKTENKEPSIM